MESECSNQTAKIEFMRRSRFESIRDKFSEISPEAEKIISKAGNDDVLLLSLTFNSPVKVVSAEVYDEDKFIDLAF